VEEYSAIPNVKVQAVSDLMDKNLQHCKDRYNVPVLANDYHDVIKVDSIHAVHICLPNSLHFPACKEALEAGKHVLVEKPITLTSKEGNILVDLAAEKGLTLSVGHIYRFNNALAEVKRLISENFFGRVFLLNLTWTNLEPIFNDRDVIVDLAPHYFDIVNYMLDAWPAKITCVAKPYRQKENPEATYISCEMPNGAIAHAHLNWLSPKKVRSIELVERTGRRSSMRSVKRSRYTNLAIPTSSEWKGTTPSGPSCCISSSPSRTRRPRPGTPVPSA